MTSESVTCDWCGWNIYGKFVYSFDSSRVNFCCNKCLDSYFNAKGKKPLMTYKDEYDPYKFL